MYKVLILDLEVENIPWHGQVASPFNPDNYIVAPGWRLDTFTDTGAFIQGEVQGRYFTNKDEAEAGASWFDVVNEADAIVCHNAQFEMRWFISRHRETFEAFLKRGGRVLDTALAEYLLSHQQTLYPSLDETAPKYGGTYKIDAVKVLWESGKLTSEIDKDLLLEYLLGPSGDIVNTAHVYYGQQPKLHEAGLWQCWLERCEAQVAYAYCESFGLYLDKGIADENYKAQLVEIDRLEAELQSILPDNLPSELQFNWGSRMQLSALLFGGPVKYTKRVPYDPPKYVKTDAYTDTVTGTVVPVAEWELYLQANPGAVQDTYSRGTRAGMVKVIRADTAEQRLQPVEALYTFPGTVQLHELPKTVSDNYLGSRAPLRGAQTLADGTTPVYSTTGESLGILAKYVPAVAQLVELTTLRKDTGTYYYNHEYNKDGTLKSTSGMLTYVGPDNIIHHSLNSTATTTTRLSSAYPNLQNLPRADADADGVAKSRVKEGFVSRFGEAGRIVEIDYTALEVVVLCAITGDTDLLKLLADGTDMHSYRLAFTLGMPYAEVRAIVKDEKHPRHAEMSKRRTDIKKLSFADQYGATASGLAYTTGVSLEEAEAFQANEAKLFPISRGYREVIAAAVAENGNLPGNMHREQDPKTGAWRIYRRGHFQAPSGTCYSFRQHDGWDSETRRHVLKYKATQMANYPFQGEAGYLMAATMGRVVRYLLSQNWYDGQVCLINNVHDAIYLDVANEDVGRVAAHAVQSIMEDASKYLTAVHPQYDIAHVPFPAAAEWGSNMLHKTHIH